jgi:hypothetical protein
MQSVNRTAYISCITEKRITQIIFLIPVSKLFEFSLNFISFPHSYSLLVIICLFSWWGLIKSMKWPYAFHGRHSAWVYLKRHLSGAACAVTTCVMKERPPSKSFCSTYFLAGIEQSTLDALLPSTAWASINSGVILSWL